MRKNGRTATGGRLRRQSAEPLCRWPRSAAADPGQNAAPRDAVAGAGAGGAFVCGATRLAAGADSCSDSRANAWSDSQPEPRAKPRADANSQRRTLPATERVFADSDAQPDAQAHAYPNGEAYNVPPNWPAVECANQPDGAAVECAN